MSFTVDKLVHLSDAHAQRLEHLAVAKRTTEDALIAEALTILFDKSALEDEHKEHQAWSALSLKAFARVWDNAADAVYDNWTPTVSTTEAG